MHGHQVHMVIDFALKVTFCASVAEYDNVVWQDAACSQHVCHVRGYSSATKLTVIHLISSASFDVSLAALSRLSWLRRCHTATPLVHMHGFCRCMCMCDMDNMQTCTLVMISTLNMHTVHLFSATFVNAHSSLYFKFNTYTCVSLCKLLCVHCFDIDVRCFVQSPGLIKCRPPQRSFSSLLQLSQSTEASKFQAWSERAFLMQCLSGARVVSLVKPSSVVRPSKAEAEFTGRRPECRC